MELHEYPRPKNDTGIGIHWSAGYASAIGLARLREFWIPEMKALGVKWVKVFNHDGALDLIDLLLNEGFMPIVRLYRPSPNPGRLGVKEVVHLDALIRAGVSYFEFNNEPDSDGEWKGGRLPTNALELVVENAIADMETILERGGMPGVPALKGGSSWDIVGRIVASGRRDLFDGPIWQALHNYPRNRPLNYPYDIGNQEGSAYTERFYRVVGEEEWGEHAWRGRSLHEVNRLRVGRVQPGATIADDHDCWLAYKHYDALNQQHLGRSLPILSTECGYQVGEDLDPRYPATTPDLHMAQTLEACRIMMGISRRFEAAPDYYFCTAFWMLANQRLGSTSDWWEGHAWYSERWRNATLPVVPALRVEPKIERRWQTKSALEQHVSVQGTIAQPALGERVVALRDGIEVAEAAVDTGGRFRLTGLTPGHYQLRLQQGESVRDVTLEAKQQHIIVNFEEAETKSAANRSVLHGLVRGGAGVVVILTRHNDGEEWVTLAHEDGRFRFVDLPPGSYAARIPTGGSHANGILLDGRNEAEVQMTAFGWGYTIQRKDDDPTAFAGAVHCVVEGHSGLTVYAERGAWRSEPVQTGGAPDHGYNRCVISPLEIGDYNIKVAQSDESGSEASGTVASDKEPLSLEARVHVDQKRVPVVTFVYHEVSEPNLEGRSRLGVEIAGANPAETISVALIDDEMQRIEQIVEDGQILFFDDLVEGSYAVEVVGHEQTARQADIQLDGTNERLIRLEIPNESELDEPETSHSRIAGTAPHTAKRLVTLVDDVGNEFNRVVDESDTFLFDNLPAGLYNLRIEGGYRQDAIQVDGTNGVSINFSPLVRSWHNEQSNAGAMPGFSTLRVEVAGKRSLPVRIWQEDGIDIVRNTGDTEGLDETVAEFRPLEAGRYMVEPEGLDVRTDVTLTGLETVWLTFRERLEPSEPNLIRELEEPTSIDAANGDESENEATGDWEAVEHDKQTTTDAAVVSGAYVFLGEGDICAQNLSTLVAFVAKYQPEMGSDMDAAVKARRVMLIGDVPSETRALLETQVSHVEILSTLTD